MPTPSRDLCTRSRGERGSACTNRAVRAVAGSPLSVAWLAILVLTTRRQQAAGRRGSERIQRDHSTNLKKLSTEPSRVLVTSAFYLDGRSWWPYVPVFAGVVAPAERRLGWWRWLLVGAAAHVGATYVGQGHLLARIRRGSAPRRLANARDVGVSYVLLGLAGALSGYVPRSWRARSQIAVGGALAVNAAARPTATEVGHLSAFAIGLAVSPWVPDRDAHPYPHLARPSREQTQM